MFFAYRTFLPDLSPADWERFYEEGKLFARLVGIEDENVPPRLDEFNTWMQTMLTSEEISVSPVAREIGNSLTSMPIRLASPLNKFLAAGTLPPKLREQFGLRWSPQRQRLFDLFSRSIRFIVARTPQFLHTSPTYWFALRRATVQR
jgi:uncharacterized protein (DUF2236 family)